MELTTLGCRSGMPADGEPSSGYLVDTGSARILLDCGPGVLTALSARLRPEELDAVVVTHLHIDHCYDLLPLGKALLAGHIRYPGAEAAGLLPPLPRPRQEPLPLYVPVGGLDLVQRLSDLFPLPTIPALNQTVGLAFDVREYVPGDTFTVADCAVRLALLTHSLPNCGVRIDSPTGSLVYTGDTGATPALGELARGADLLLAEATLGASDPGPHGHLSGADAGRAAADAEVSTLVLTHYASAEDAWTKGLQEEAGQHFAGSVELARPGSRHRVVPG